MKNVLLLFTLILMLSNYANAARFMWQDPKVFLPEEKRHLRVLLSNKKNETIESVMNSKDFREFQNMYFKCSNGYEPKKYNPVPSYMIELAGKPGSWLSGEFHPISAWIITCKTQKQIQASKDEAIMFNIKVKREQCEAIGFKPETEKFADCVLRLVELDVKQQTQNQIAVAQNNGNDALVKQLKRQSDLQSSQALIDLGQQLMNPKRYNSNIYMPQTQRCTMQGFGTFATMRCR